jgi:SOS response regulatory protein OraA/RecX
VPVQKGGSMAKDFLTDEQVELEIARLQTSQEVQLAKKELNIKYKRRQYLYQLRHMEKRGRQLMQEGITLENIESILFGDDNEF